MTKTKEDFDALVEMALAQGGTKDMRPVIEKELLHYDILFALDESKLLDRLVFQGGTSLRLCRGSNRYSEDLDFAGGKDFSSKMLIEMKEVIEKYIGERYGLEVTVKEPSSLKQDPKYAELNIDKWQIAVVTSPGQKHLAKQRIKLEIANIPAYTKEPLPLGKNYDFLPDGYSSTLIYTETLDEVMADKIISLPATQKYIRYRDVWDLVFLKRNGAVLNICQRSPKTDPLLFKNDQSKLTHLFTQVLLLNVVYLSIDNYHHSTAEHENGEAVDLTSLLLVLHHRQMRLAIAQRISC